MKKNKYASRIFGGSDAEMLETAKTLYNSFLRDIKKFTEYDPAFNENFAQGWLADIEAADNIQKEDSVADMMTGLTQKVNDLMEECSAKFKLTRHFIRKAFPQNKAAQNEFGFNDFPKTSKNQPKMIQFMRNFQRAADKYSEQLIAANYTAENIAEIKTLADELDAANTEQESFKKDRIVMSQHRISVLNTCWEKCVQIANLGKLIFRDEPAAYNKYVLYHQTAAGEVAEPSAQSAS